MARPKKEIVEPSTNEQWYLYLVNYWVPFPSSEYGGLQCVLARTKEEAAEAIKEEAGEFIIGSFKDADERIQQRVNKAEVFPVIGNFSEPHIVRSFET